MWYFTKSIIWKIFLLNGPWISRQSCVTVKCVQKWDSVLNDSDEMKLNPVSAKGPSLRNAFDLWLKHYSKSVEGILLARAHSEVAKGQYSI